MIINSLNKPGIYHKSKNIKNQDFVLSDENEKFCVIALADGVSSCKMSGEGAEISCKTLVKLFLERGNFFFNSDIHRYKREMSELILSYILSELAKKSDNIKEYSSTISSVIYNKENNKILCFNLGDGIIISNKCDKAEIIIKPYQNDDGCCVTTTVNAEFAFDIEIFDFASMDTIMILSDGAWKPIFENKNFSFIQNGISFSELNNYLDSIKCLDDYSYISITKGGF
ncbi:MAG: protein phosphatase 2C domain-containing protein [Synergistaceae bacterium]|nr:protein phosphatase 2C domain-containing protein [Synergistaceae bacterium]